ncbi:MAG: hypothetical protein Q9169_004563 [Polycauliona sp. 2 TL-2023]
MPRVDEASDKLCTAMQDPAPSDTGQPAEDAPLVLDRLPTEIQRLIYVNLLKADLVREPPDECLVRPYPFHTAILSVSKRIHAIAHRILYQENHFVVVSGNHGKVVSTLKDFGVAIVSTKSATVAQFNHHMVRIHLAYPFSDSDDENPKHNVLRHSFIVLHDELPGVVQMLKTIDAMRTGATNAYQIKFRIEIPKGKPNQTAQIQVLEPFRQLGNACRSVKIFGFDTEYTKDLIHDMMFPYQWTRAVEWSLYDMMVFHFHIAEDALRAGNVQLAVSQFSRCYVLWLVPVAKNDRLGYSHDSNCQSRMCFLFSAAQTNIVLLGLKYPNVRRENGGWHWLLETASWIDLPNVAAVRELRGISHHYRGMIHILMDGNLVSAVEEFEAAKFWAPGNALLDDHIRMTMQSLRQDIHASSLVDLITVDQLPFTINRLSDQPGDEYAPSDLIATERAILRKLRYKGDLLMHIPTKKPVNQNDVDSVEEALQKLKSHPMGYDPQDPVWLSVAQLEGGDTFRIAYGQ